MSLNSSNAENNEKEPLKFRDELIENTAATESARPSHPVRHVNLIMDHSAFIRGIGHIKRWFNREYMRTHRKNAADSESIEVCIYIPAYTLHEFDYAKKGATMMATNAREAVRLVEELIEDEYHVLYEDENNGSRIRIRVSIEGPSESGPPWQNCLKYKIQSPKVKDFPNRKTTFDSNRAGSRSMQSNLSMGEYDGFDDEMFGDFDVEDTSAAYLHTESELRYRNATEGEKACLSGDMDAEMPTRLRYLIRLIIFKQYVKKIPKQTSLEEWKLVTEDPITQIWSRSYGIDCLNVNEAELLMLQNYDATANSSCDPHNYKSETGPFHHAIDTTQYKYVSLNDPALNSSSRRKYVGPRNKATKVATKTGRYVDGFVSNNNIGVNGESVKKERFDAINFAPRGQGKLWKRPAKTQQKLD